MNDGGGGPFFCFRSNFNFAQVTRLETLATQAIQNTSIRTKEKTKARLLRLQTLLVLLGLNLFDNGHK